MYIAKFQINNCFEDFTHEPIVFAHYFEKFTKYLYYIKNYFISLLYKDLQKSSYCFTPFFKELYQNQSFFLFKHVYLNSFKVKFQMLIAR